MSTIKKAIIALVGAIPLMLPLGIGAVAHASEVEPLQCSYPETQVQDEESGINGCDLGIDKTVSVDGGNTFVEADTSATAAQTTVGKTVIWQITVSNQSDAGYTPYGTITVNDILPSAGVSYVSSSATAGTYDNNAGTWTIPLTNGDEGTNLPATLTITTTSTATGLFENTATLATYSSCGDDCGTFAYSDSNPDNDSNSAWIDPSAQPVVLGTSTTTTPTQSLTNTGNGTALQTLAAGTLMAATAATLLVGRRQTAKTRR
jgi:uncharacterized repeat protein (TIGR01451 family)